MITRTYALGSQDIHGQYPDQSLTLCGSWASDVKPMGPSAVTCLDCRAVVAYLERQDENVAAIETYAESTTALNAAIRESGLTVVRDGTT